MKWNQRASVALFATAAVLATGCSTSRDTIPIITSTGLPYYPPGPVTMVDMPPGFAPTLPARPISEAALAPTFTPRPLRTGMNGRFVDGQGIDSNAWRADAAHWIGTPYRMGGEDHNGIDCSGYVNRLYQEVAGQALPRSSGDLWQKGEALGIGNLEPGDLVFFQTTGPDEVSHVGVSLGGREFTHASTSKGVTISSMDEPYWHEHFTGARRILLR